MDINSEPSAQVIPVVGANGASTEKPSMASFLDDDTPKTNIEAGSVASKELDDIFAQGGDDIADGENGQGDGADTSTQSSDLGELSLEDLTDEESDSPAKLEVYSKDCLRCKALVPWETKTKMSCHHSRGNEHCPALTVQIVTRIPLEKIVPRILQAEANNDTEAIAKFYMNLAKREPWQQEIIHAAIRDNRP
jgi:hypothetical protein